MFRPVLLFVLVLNPRGSNLSAILPRSKCLTVRAVHPHLERDQRAVLCEIALRRTCMCISSSLVSPLISLSFRTPSRHITGKFQAHAPARSVPAFFLCTLPCRLCFFSVTFSQEEDFSDTIPPLTLKKKGASAPREAYDGVAQDKTPTPPPSASSPSVYLEDM